MRARHISIFLPLETPFYAALLEQMRRGFAECGVATSGGLGHLGADAMACWCAAHKPDVIFEMNRAGAEAKGRPPGVGHASWIVDFNGHSLDHFEGSHATYLFGPSWVDRFPFSSFHRWLGPGACLATYPRATHQRECGASFAGYIPRPWSEAECARDVTGGAGALSFGQLLPRFEVELEDARDSLQTADDFVTIAERCCEELCGAPLALDSRLRSDLTVRVIRDLNRRGLVDAVLDAGLDVELYGPAKWAQWPRYKPHYRGWLDTPAALHALYGRSHINLHEGNGVHFRSMDVMASGGLLFFRSTVNDDKTGGINSTFAPDEHYVPFALSTFAEAVARYEDPAEAHRVREAAANEVAANHTWRARASSILRDLAAI